MSHTFYFNWEVGLMTFLQSHMGRFGVALAGLFTYFGETVIIVLIMGYLYWCRDKELGKYLGINMAAALVWNPLLKNVVFRARPYVDHEAIACLKPVNGGDIYDLDIQGYSFPSGHATNAATVYGSIAMWVRKKPLVIPALILIFLVGLSRVCLGVHYPTDVLGGWLLGGGVVLLVGFLQKKIRTRWKLFALLMAVSLPGCFYCTSTDYFSTLGIMIGMFAGILFEERFVGFENASTTPERTLRLIGGVALFALLHAGMKLIFPADLLRSTEAAGMFLRVLRHAVEVFIIVGPYTMIFSRLKIGDRNRGRGERSEIGKS